MLDDFVIDEPVVHKVLTNSFKKNKISHAYLFELNGYSKGLELAVSFAKAILCPNNYHNCNNCGNCTQCTVIDNKDFLELKIITPDGAWIKKEQLEELQREFNRKALIGSRKIYIISEAEKLNESASNSILKFLEEPVEGITAILLTNNKYQLLNTITSRCQLLTFKAKKNVNVENTQNKIAAYLYNNQADIDEFIKYDTDNNIIEFVDSYISYYENSGLKTIIFKNKKFIEQFDDRKKLNIAFKMLILYYNDVLNCFLERPIVYFKDYVDNIKSISLKNSAKEIAAKIKIIYDNSQKIRYNVNSNLLMDKLIIELEEVCHV